MNTINPAQPSLYRSMAVSGAQLEYVKANLAMQYRDLWRMKTEMAANTYDLYSPDNSYFNVMNYTPAKLSEQTGYEILDMAKGKDYRQLMYDLPVLSLTGAGLDVVGENMLSSILNRFQLMDEFEVLLKHDDTALKHGFLVGRTTYDADRLRRLAPEKYVTEDMKKITREDVKKMMSGDIKNFTSEDMKKFGIDPDAQDVSDQINEIRKNLMALVKDPDAPDAIVDAQDAVITKQMNHLAQTDKDFHYIDSVNAGRWRLPFVLDPAINPGINFAVKSTTGLDWDTVSSFLPSNNEVPPLWQDPELPQYPWQNRDCYPNGWMDQHTPEKGFKMKSPWELEMDSKREQEEGKEGGEGE